MLVTAAIGHSTRPGVGGMLSIPIEEIRAAARHRIAQCFSSEFFPELKSARHLGMHGVPNPRSAHCFYHARWPIHEPLISFRKPIRGRKCSGPAFRS